MTRRIFYAGFSSKVIDAKWPAFETAFFAFEPHACVFMANDYFEALLADTCIVRNGAKIRSVQVNARFVLDLAASHGSAGRFFADWSDAEPVVPTGVLLRPHVAGRRLRVDDRSHSGHCRRPKASRSLVRSCLGQQALEMSGASSYSHHQGSTRCPGVWKPLPTGWCRPIRHRDPLA